MVRLIEVGPRDGLQNEPTPIPTEVKIAFCDVLSASGVDELEVSAFVAKPRVPQLADAEQVFRAIVRHPGVVYSALVPNVQGLERALEVGVDKVAVFTAASERFNRANINASIREAHERCRAVTAQAKAAGKLVRGYVSTAFHCPYEGYIVPEKVVAVSEALLGLGVDELSIGDTIGKASADDVRALLDALLRHVPVERCTMHFHDTYGQAANNVRIAWELGIRAFDASTGGIGGCPFAPGAPGNVAMERVVQTLRELGAEVRVDSAALESARTIVAPYLAPKLVRGHHAP